MASNTPYLFLFLFLSSSFANAVTSSLSPSPSPSPSPSRVVCDEAFSCPRGNTCCCVYRATPDAACYTWSCCPYENATCCDGRKCCPQEYPVCIPYAGSCNISNSNPLGAIAMITRIPAEPMRNASGEKSSF